MIRSRLILLCMLCMAFVFSAVVPASAAYGDWLRHQDMIVPAGQQVENVVVAGGDVEIRGTVRDMVLVLNGNLTIKKTARVNGAVFVFGGLISQEPGASLTDNVVNVSLDTPTQSNLFAAGAALVGYWFVKLAVSLILIIVSLFIAIVARDRMMVFTDHIQRSFRQLILIGMAVTLLLGSLVVLLSLTVIGIPVALVILAVLLLFFFIGLASAAVWIGRMIPALESNLPLSSLAGAAVLIAGFNFPFFGLILFCLVLCLSLGMMGLWVRGKVRQLKRNREV
ncbi:hypothetical protein PP175_19905 [Aneurinibacillus sp. Ricciae_BoGa-3]|uniref:hypothetical protein n=1 Tax=Aneurinibacillus sp. Ricciae_BoGa-3 TaxID=3022697 RepID=UPI002341D6C1|nr:hypothetical protein [Aneurinibacillus sp. Ricciae_BoGa-3]WCK53576.1 hypothetical protein PP175_19905 [Aneurinibacillus sp. Ricciae_BoGa-3]